MKIHRYGNDYAFQRNQRAIPEVKEEPKQENDVENKVPAGRGGEMETTPENEMVGIHSDEISLQDKEETPKKKKAKKGEGNLQESQEEVR